MLYGYVRCESVTARLWKGNLSRGSTRALRNTQDVPPLRHMFGEPAPWIARGLECAIVRLFVRQGERRVHPEKGARMGG